MAYRNFDKNRIERQIASSQRYEELYRKSVTLSAAQERALKQATAAARLRSGGDRNSQPRP